MLTKRIIPCLDVKDGRTVKGINFVGLRDAGDPVELAARYAFEGADELVFLDITATVERRKTLLKLVKQVAQQVNIPFTVGGGISSLRDVSEVLEAGADKVAINSAAVRNPDLIDEISKNFGSQCLVVAVDSRYETGTNWVFVNGGRKKTELETIPWCKEIEARGGGEILLTSMDHDGTKQGFASDLMVRVNAEINIPVIASGGGGGEQHFVDIFKNANADAALAASIFHFGEIKIQGLKKTLADNNINVRLE